MTSTSQQPVLVTGATGKTGRRVATHLVARGVPVRLASRGGEPRFDWDDRATWAPALAGAGAAYVAFAPDLAVPGAADLVEAFAVAAAAHDVGRVVLLSGRGEPGAQRAEAAVRAAVPATTIVRCSFFAQNFTEGAWADEVRAGELALPVDPAVREPFVDVDDVADVAVAALTEDGHAGRTYEVTGPRAMTFAEAVGAFGAAFVPVTAAAYRDALSAAAVPPELTELLMHLLTEVLDGRNTALADGVQQALGRPPRDLADLARALAPAVAAG